jgi:pimeloyl-ACP methyl ester carboxylesterase
MHALVAVFAIACLLGCGRTPAEGGSARAQEPLASPQTHRRPERPSEAPLVERSEPTAAAVMRARGSWTVELRLENAAFEVASAPSVLVHAPPGFDPAQRPLRMVVFLHGWIGCVRMLALEGPTPCRDGERPREGWGLADRFDAGGPDALLVVPQLAFMERDGSPGRFREPGRFRAFVEELLAALAPQLGVVSRSELAPFTLLAHSAGFETALALLARGEVEVGSVVLFDALYAGVEPFATWLAGAPERRLVSLYTGRGRTARQTGLLARRARTLLPPGAVAVDPSTSLAEALRAHRLVVASSPVGHGVVPSRHLPEIVEGLGLRRPR